MSIEVLPYQGIDPLERLSFSIGAVVVTSLDPEEAQVAMIVSPPEYTTNPWGITDFATTMRETPEEGESADAALHRGLAEELGVKGSIVTCLGITSCDVQRFERHWPKLTLYRLVLYGGHVPRPPADEVDGQLHVEWLPIRDALEGQRRQAPRMRQLGRPDLDEQQPLERAIAYMSGSNHRI
jgi:hypothetical protein